MNIEKTNFAGWYKQQMINEGKGLTMVHNRFDTRVLEKYYSRSRFHLETFTDIIKFQEKYCASRV